MAYRIFSQYIEYDRKVDVYAFGVLMYEIVSHRAPWAGVHSRKVFGRVFEGERPSLEIDHAALPGWVELMESCWAQDPDDRPEFDNIFTELKIIKRDHSNMAWQNSNRSVIERGSWSVSQLYNAQLEMHCQAPTRARSATGAVVLEV